jgi:hypothetical protein
MMDNTDDVISSVIVDAEPQSGACEALPSMPKREWMKMARDVQRVLKCTPCGRALFIPAVMRCAPDGRVKDWMEIARAANISRASLCRVVADWKAQGLVYTHQGVKGGGFNLDAFVELYRKARPDLSQIDTGLVSNCDISPTYYNNSLKKRNKKEDASRYFSSWTDKDEDVAFDCNWEVV